MKTAIPRAVTQTTAGRQMVDILHTCVHCGMCNATCPTYQLLGNELDGPRGRIYLVKSMLEGEQVSKKTQTHLDRCLTCRSCETTCPSGVKYGHLVELARPEVERRVGRGFLERAHRWLIKQVVPFPKRFALAVWLGRLLKPLLPQGIAELVPQQNVSPRVDKLSEHSRRMLLLEGCAQSVVAPSINQATRELFNRLEVSVEAPPSAGCCGAVNYHLNDIERAATQARMNIDAWWPEINRGAEGLLVPSSGCAAMIKDYPQLFSEDDPYRDKAKRVAALVSDPAEKIDPAQLKNVVPRRAQTSIAFQVPCTMQHATHSDHAVRRCLDSVGFKLTTVPDQHLCCGSAGSYSLLQSELSTRLLDNKLAALASGEPEMIVTGNIGCHMHLSRRAKIPVKHWIEAIISTD